MYINVCGTRVHVLVPARSELNADDDEVARNGSVCGIHTLMSPPPG